MNKIFTCDMEIGVNSAQHRRCALFRSRRSLRSCKSVRNQGKNGIVVGSLSPGASHPLRCNLRKDCIQEGWISCKKTMEGVSRQSSDPQTPTCRLNALPLHMAAMVAWGQGLPAQFSAIISRGILAASLKASIKLGLICLVLGWLYKRKMLPEETAPVLSKVAFNLCIPCMLFTRIAETLAVTQNVALLWIPLASGIQIMGGYGVGLLAARLLVKGAFFLPKESISAPTNAASTASASTAGPASTPKASSPPPGLAQLVTVSCMFGNALTLPLIFLLTLLPAATAGPTTANIAMFLIGWSPIFWSWGFNILGSSDDNSNQGEVKRMSRYSGLPGLKKPIPVGFLEASTSASASGGLASGGSLAINPLPIADRFFAFLYSAQEKAIQLAKQVLTLPLAAVIAGCVLGLSPLGRAIFTPTGAQDLALYWSSTKTGEAVVLAMVSALKSAMEVMVLFGEAMLPIGVVILACSLFAKDKNKEATDGASESQSLFRFLIPEDVFERRAIVLVSFARFFAVPIVGLASVKALASFGFLPPDPVCHMAILMQAAMPPAQNLTLMMNLREHTRKLVPAAAPFLMRMYILSLIGPIMIWTTIFAMATGVQLA
ncbi:hypothetical protein BSKO_11753 [Bryopsis sp. KO-2023]|nr:hypothetical protein BSKO_11753 [Bryopsis sp. KO-2023]